MAARLLDDGGCYIFSDDDAKHHHATHDRIPSFKIYFSELYFGSNTEDTGLPVQHSHTLHTDCSLDATMLHNHAPHRAAAAAAAAFKNDPYLAIEQRH